MGSRRRSAATPYPPKRRAAPGGCSVAGRSLASAPDLSAGNPRRTNATQRRSSGLAGPHPFKLPVGHSGRPNSLRSSTFARLSMARRSPVKFVPARLISKFSMDIAERKGLDLRR